MKKEDKTKAPRSTKATKKKTTPASDLSRPGVRQIIGIDGKPLTFADGSPITNAHFDFDVIPLSEYEYPEDHEEEE